MARRGQGPTKPACWRWKPPADIGAVLLTEEMRRDWLERNGKIPRLRKYAEQMPEQAQWRLLLGWHRFRCAMCGKSVRDDSRLVKDHDHETGLIRGLLCYPCNIIEGRSGGDVIDKYRERPPAVICGVRLIYA